MFGILNIYKPPVWTSRDVVNRVQRLVRPDKVGHAGTLDPLATGVLVTCIGQATRLISYIQRMDKEYTASFLLGRTSPSDDTETEVTELRDPPFPNQAQIESALPSFVGTTQQRPPAYSAVKIDGQRAYSLARGGREVTIMPRPVEIYDIAVLEYAYPTLTLAIRCGRGTYIRSLGRDLAAALGTGAVMSRLTRTRIGSFSLNNSLSVEELTLDRVESELLPAVRSVDTLPQLVLTDAQINELRFGRAVPADETRECAGIDYQGNLIAILTPKSIGLLKPHINFAPTA